MGDAHRDAHARVLTRQRGVKVGSPQGSFLNSAGVPATGPAIPPNTPGGEFLNRGTGVRVSPGALSNPGFYTTDTHQRVSDWTGSRSVAGSSWRASHNRL